MADDLDTRSLFKAHFISWNILGMLPPKWIFPPLYWMYSLIIHIVLVVGFPLHLVVGLLSSTTMYEAMQNMTLTITSVVCVLKTYAIWWEFRSINLMFDIIRRQDGRLRSSAEALYLKTKVYPLVRLVIVLFYVLCLSVGGTAEMAVLVNGLRGNWRLMYEAYFPFDPYATKWTYLVAHLFQFIGFGCDIIQNLVNDTFAATHLALLGGHVRILGKRVAQIGDDPCKSQAENNQELLQCIADHKDLLLYHAKLEKVISMYMFFQIVLSSMNMCMVLVFVVLFVQDPFTLAFNASMIIGMVCEILPSCYYGTILEEEFQNLTFALFACNWMDQSVEFKKNLLIFAEKTSRRIYVMAWLFRINNDSFIIAYKNTYSLFALILNMK